MQLNRTPTWVSAIYMLHLLSPPIKALLAEDRISTTTVVNAIRDQGGAENGGVERAEAIILDSRPGAGRKVFY